MITKTAVVYYAQQCLYKEAAAFPTWGGIKSGIKAVGNFLGNLGFTPKTVGAVTPAAATVKATAPRMRQVVQGNRRSMALARGQRRMHNVQRANAIRQANSVPKQTTTPMPSQTTTPMPGQVNTPMPSQTTTPMPGNPTPAPQFTQEQMNSAKNSNLLGGAIIGAGALGGINYVGNRVFGQPQRPPMMMMPMPMY